MTDPRVSESRTEPARGPGGGAIDYGAIVLSGQLPPLGNAARQLLGLSEEETEDARVLNLIAQRDPVHLGRLLALANSSSRGLSRPVITSDDAIRVIGTRDAHAAMVAIAMATSFPARDDSAAVRRWLQRHSVNLVLTARRVGSFLGLEKSRMAMLVMAALFDPLGVHAAISLEHPQRAALLEALQGATGASARWPDELPELSGYWRLSAIVARAWSAPDEVALLLESRWDGGDPHGCSDDSSLLWLCHQLLARSLAGEKSMDWLARAPHPLSEGVAAKLASDRASELAFSGA